MVFKKAQSEAERIDRIKTLMTEKRAERIEKANTKLTNDRELFKLAIARNKRLRDVIISNDSVDPTELFDAILRLNVIYVDSGQLTRAIVHDVDKNNKLTNLLIDTLREAGVIIGETSRWMRWCDTDSLSAMIKQPRGIVNHAVNEYFRKKAKRNFLYQLTSDGKVRIVKHPKYEPLTEDQKTAMLEKARLEEHKKRVGVPDLVGSEIDGIHHAADIEIARIRAERKMLLEQYKPYFLGLLVILLLLWFVNGLSK